MMLMTKLKTATAVLMARVVFGVGAAALMQPVLAGKPADQKVLEKEVPPPAGAALADIPEAKPASGVAPQTDAAGDPLPVGALARIGSWRFRHADQIGHLAFTPDSTIVISHGPSGTRVWEAATGKEISHIAHENIQACDVSMDGKLLALLPASPANVVTFYDVKSGRRLRDISQPRQFSLARFAPGGTALLTLDSDAAIKLWDPLTGKMLETWKGPVNTAPLATFSSDGKVMAVASGDQISLWDTPARRELKRIKHESGVQRISLSADGQLLATLGVGTEPERMVRIWDTGSGKELRQVVLPTKQPGAFGEVLFLPDGKTLVTSDDEPALRIWDARTAKELRCIPVDCYAVFGLTCSPDGKVVATAAGGLAIRLFDPHSGKDLAPPVGHQLGIGKLTLSRDRRSLVTVSDRQIQIWSPVSGALRFRFNGHEKHVTDVCLAPDERTLFSIDQDGIVHVWDIVNGKKLRQFKLNVPPGSRRIAIAPDGKSMALTGAKSILIVDSVTGKERKECGTYEHSAQSLALLDSGRKLAVCTRDHKLDLWDYTLGRKLSGFSFPKERGPSQGNLNLAFYTAVSPDGRIIAYGSQEKYLALMEIATGRELAFFDNLADAVGPMTFSPDGRTLAWGGWRDPTVRLVEVASGNERRRFLGHRGRITAVTFSADGNILVSGGLDTTAVVWDIAGQPSAKDNPLSPQDLSAFWADLADTNAERAHLAVRKLARDPARAVPFLDTRLQPVTSVEEKRLSGLIADLDANEFSVRAKASRELDMLGELATAACRRALDAQPGVEVRRRLEQVLESHKQQWRKPPTQTFRELRALEVLELAGTPEARKTLARMAQGASESRVTADAVATLGRLSQ
jgi:WD40 repeat protein